MKKLIEKRNDLITRAEEIINLAKTENRELSAEEMTEFNTIKSEVENIDKTLEAEKQFRAMDIKKPEEKKEDKTLEIREVKVGSEIVKVRVDEWNAFESYIRGTVNERTGELTPASTSGGAVIPTTIVDYIIRKVYNICPILDRSQKFNVKGKLDIPFYPADSNKITVAYKDEFSALTSTSGKISSVELTGFLAGCLTKVSRSLINNTNFNIVGFVVDEMAYAIARFIEGELLNGTSGKVTGLSTLTNGVTAASATAITADEVIKLHDKIKDQFQRNAIWIMSSATRTALRLLKDNMGRYMLQDDISLPFETSLLGKPVYVSDNMPEIATGNVAIYYGDMHGLATKFNEDINIEVLRERYADEHCYGVIGWLEFDSKVIDEQQIAKLTMA